MFTTSATSEFYIATSRGVNHMKAKTWKEALATQMPADLSHQIDLFEGQIELRRQGKIDEKVFAETRLRRGVYGQRYDNGQRHDGIASQTLPFPCGSLTKGPETVFDAPGMQRIKVPYGGMSVRQLEELADVAEEYSDCILHVTTRQDIQLHFVHIDDTPDMMRRLAKVGITTQEACGNSVRNITGCPTAGVCHDEAFDISPYAKAMTEFLLGHPDIQDFGRKFKIAFSGCEDKPCGLVMLHDLGCIAQTREVDGQTQRGFKMFLGGGLGTVPHQAKMIYEFVTEEELLPVTQAVSRVYAKLGEKKNRNRARIKFLIAKMGIDAFREEVEKERAQLPHDLRWTAYIEELLPNYKDEPLKESRPLAEGEGSEAFRAWYETNVYAQRQADYSTVTIYLPLGDFTSEQSRALADIAREFSGAESIRTTVEQNLVIRWVSNADLPALFERLTEAGLGGADAGTIADITSCPGTDTCKLGIAASRGLAGELTHILRDTEVDVPPAAKELRIKVSGCFNSCGQHHVADIGFYGNSRKIGSHAVPHFQVVLGGMWKKNAGSYGLAVGAVPSKRIPEVLEALTHRYAEEREEGQDFQEWIASHGKKAMRSMLKPFMNIPSYEDDPSYYSDWGDPREFSTGDLGIGECAGEVVSLFSMEIAKAESEAFDAQIALEEKDFALADQKAYKAMLMAAMALIRTQTLNVAEQPDSIVEAFKTRFYDTKLFFDKYAKGKFAHYLFERHQETEARSTYDNAHRTVEEAQLFIEASHACDARLSLVTPV